MRKFAAIARTTALEILSEPFVLLTTLTSLALAILAPAMHYHQFGESTRMARDAAISAILVGGSVIAVFGTIKSWRRELESGTAFVALAHSVSRRTFFLAKTFGALVAYTVFAVTATGVALTMINGSRIGGEVSLSSGMLERIWGPSLALSVAVIVVPLVSGLLLNRFAAFRFVLTANLLAALVAVPTVAYRFDPSLVARMFPLLSLAACPGVLLLFAASAFGAAFKLNAAVSLAILMGLAFLPFVGNYCLSDSVRDLGSIPVRIYLGAVIALVPALAALTILGVRWARTRIAR